MGARQSQGVTKSLVLFCLFATAIAKKFPDCQAKVLGILNGTIANESSFDIIYHGPLRGFDSNKPRPLTLTFDGCVEACGGGSQLNDVVKAFAILTTWVLPAVALLSQLPYESLSNGKGKNFEAFVNWIGAPTTALATTMYNIHLIRKCLSRVSRYSGNQEIIARDSYFVLSCINQYEYPSSLSTQQQIDERDKALFYGIQRPLDTAVQHAEDTIKLKELISHLAFQLRLQRRRGVWPLSISVLWFLVAFIISIVTAFVDLGDNTTAHSLSLGLLLSWLPVLVVMMIVDRNPVAATRCKVLIERWLHNVDKIRKHYHPQHIVPRPPPGQPLRLWGEPLAPVVGAVPENDNPPLKHSIGEYVGQGRRLRYCGVANAILNCEGRPSRPERPENPGLSITNMEVDVFRKHLVKRDRAWWGIFFLSFAIITNSFGMAFMVSFRTPTVGLGCRSLLTMVFYLLSLCSFIFLAIFQEPSREVQLALIIPNTLAMFMLTAIMVFQVTNGLNNCRCKSTMFALGISGYMDFENAVFYKNMSTGW